jgi:hypothetical protein
MPPLNVFSTPGQAGAWTGGPPGLTCLHPKNKQPQLQVVFYAERGELGDERRPENLPRKVLEAAFKAHFEGNKFEFDMDDVILIASDSGLRSKFRKLFYSHNDPEVQRSIVEYLDEVPGRLEAQAARSENFVGLIDQAGMSVASATTVAGLVTLLTEGATTASIMLLVAGLGGLALGGIGRFMVKSTASQKLANASQVRRLVAIISL